MSALEQPVGGFVTVARIGDVEPGTVRVVEIDGRSLCVGLTEDGEWGAIDPIQLFYAQTRGLDPDAAERMIVRGFFEQVVAQVHDETIRERVLGALAGRIGSGEEEAA